MSAIAIVVGAGPGGMAAATEAAKAGGAVLLLDEYAQAGGQYYRRPGAGMTLVPTARLAGYGRDGEGRIEQAVKAGVRLRSDTLVWGAFKDGSLALYSNGHCEALRPGKVILACGATERVVAFPGWTLPGVITAGAAQALLKGHGVLPGRKILMTGTGPLQVAVAAQLVQAGAKLVGVLEASKAGRLFGSGPRFWGQWGRLGEGIQYWRTLRSAKVPMLFGRTVIRAAGNGSLSKVITAELDENWSPIAGTESELEVDTLCLGYGLVPNTKLARLAGCQLVYDPARGGHVPVLDDQMQSSVPGIFVVGEAAGIAGAKAAELQGVIAGVSAALQLEKGDPTQAKRSIEAAQRELKGEMRFAKSLNEVFAPRPGILDLLTDDTVICRCEEITAGRLLKDRPEWTASLDAARTATRVGMGNCQGTMCETLVAQLLARETGKQVAEVGTFHIRAPLKPLPIGPLADLSQSFPKPPKEG